MRQLLIPGVEDAVEPISALRRRPSPSKFSASKLSKRATRMSSTSAM